MDPEDEYRAAEEYAAGAYDRSARLPMADDVKEQFGDTLRALLKKHKISQRKLAKWANLNYVTINRFLSDAQKPEQSSVEAIAYCYGFSDEERIALFRAALCVPSALIELFAFDEEFARECWTKSHKPLQVCMTTRQPRVYA
jgi:transcriptional regulator with XRE-family HTH domain